VQGSGGSPIGYLLIWARWIGIEYSIVGIIQIIELGRSELNICSQNDWIRRIEIKYSVLGMIGLGRSELNIQ